ncbi:hypothetical protein VTJ83DRAFT_7573 [Remersonia thermophila]|uniref:MARVEL domain-containing protein n=1 Tax=Remersonia thermophila TaxID=72144 RepID=A0ABR4D411_9PEZI
MDLFTTGPPNISSRPMWVTKFIFRVLQLILSATVIGQTGAMYSQGAWYGLQVVCIIPVTGLSTGWALAEGIALLARDGHRGIHPGANVAIDLVIWLAVIPAITLVYIVNPMYPGWGTYDYYEAKYNSSYRYNKAADGLGLAALILEGFLGAFHFVTFVIACVETNRRNSRARIVVVSNNGLVPQYVPVAAVVYPSQYQPVIYQSYQRQAQPHSAEPPSYRTQNDTPQPPRRTYQQGMVASG